MDGVDLMLEDGAFLAILGPSGCGKSSLLRLIAGLETPTAGSVGMGGRDVTKLPPKDRDVAMVFQGLALYPHMTVAETMGLGLRARKTPAAEVDRRVREAAETLGLTRYLAKRPRELSGGERRLGHGSRWCADPDFSLREPISRLDARRQETGTSWAAPPPHEHNVHLRAHDRGALAGRPRGGDARRAGAAARIPRSDLPGSSRPLRGAVRGRAADQPDRGGGRKRRPGRGVSGPRLATGPGRARAARGEGAAGASAGMRGGLGRSPPAGGSGEIPPWSSCVEHLGGESLLHAGGEWGHLVCACPPSRAPSRARACSSARDPAARSLRPAANGERLG